MEADKKNANALALRESLKKLVIKKRIELLDRNRNFQVPSFFSAYDLFVYRGSEFIMIDYFESDVHKRLLGNIKEMDALVQNLVNLSVVTSFSYDTPYVAGSIELSVDEGDFSFEFHKYLGACVFELSASNLYICYTICPFDRKLRLLVSDCTGRCELSFVHSKEDKCGHWYDTTFLMPPERVLRREGNALISVLEYPPLEAATLRQLSDMCVKLEKMQDYVRENQVLGIIENKGVAKVHTK